MFIYNNTQINRFGRIPPSMMKSAYLLVIVSEKMNDNSANQAENFVNRRLIQKIVKHCLTMTENPAFRHLLQRVCFTKYAKKLPFAYNNARENKS